MIKDTDDIVRKKPLTPKQAKVMRVLRAGGILVNQHGSKERYRLLDASRSPIVIIQGRTFSALKNSERIIRTEIYWIANPKRRISKHKKL